MKTQQLSLFHQSTFQSQLPRPEGNHDGFVVGALVRSTINRELMGRIVSLPDGPLDEATQARVQLITFPTPFWARWSGRPVPFLVGNLELVAQEPVPDNTAEKGDAA